MSVDQADIGTSACAPLEDDVELLERQAQTMFRADLVERASWYLSDMDLTDSTCAACETLLVDRLLSAGAVLPVLDEGAQAKTWAKDIWIEERLRSGSSLREACREIVRAAGESPASGRSVSERVDDEEAAFRSRLARRAGVERDLTEPSVRELSALLMLGTSLREAAQTALGLARHLAVVECVDARRRDEIRSLEGLISEVEQGNAGGGLVAARQLDILRQRRARLLAFDRSEILTSLLVCDRLAGQILSANPSEAGDLIDRMLLERGPSRG
ncbi:MAG: hypothetical protein A2623_09525 [Caulobacterales bacterium RIFCSPHIGHO2_01_FULL_70_19]|nr:MAG: hypothetical protein A2623_09525 [Caulobacterales bacterium RIFCSPHIGHO2_01_FULL_70_19]